jgi:hypothetical protein
MVKNASISYKLRHKDYVNILSYYKINIPKSAKRVKQVADKIMANKLCRCIKKVEPFNEVKSIGICTKTIFNRKGYKRGKFTCKKKQSVVFRKTNNK